MITNSHALPSPLRVPTWSARFENRNFINQIAAALCSCTSIPLDTLLEHLVIADPEPR
jgi:hypothetical protein